MLADPSKYYGAFAPKVTKHLEMLTYESAGEAKWPDAIFSIIKTIAPK